MFYYGEEDIYLFGPTWEGTRSTSFRLCLWPQ